jgi:hypothetical protein
LPTFWVKARFNPAGNISQETARLSLPGACTLKAIEDMVAQLTSERTKFLLLMKGEVALVLRIGAEICGMTVICKSSGRRRPCITVADIRNSYCHDGSDTNVKRLHWMFSVFPYTNHQDVLARRESHEELAVRRVMRSKGIQWANGKTGELKRHRNCLLKLYSRAFNEFKQRVLKNGHGNTHNRMPKMSCPNSFKNSGGETDYKRGKLMFYIGVGRATRDTAGDVRVS